MNLHSTANNFACKHFVLHNPVNPLIGVIGVQTNEVQRKRSELRMFMADADSRGFRHNPPCLIKIGCNRWRARYN
jgi:hypothetical protein